MQRVDFLIITALASELDAILRKLPNTEPIAPIEGDIHTYYGADLSVTSPNGSEKSYKIIVAPLLTMGIDSTTLLIYHAIQRWDPENILLVGIAGGLSKKVSLGDILISDEIISYSLNVLRSPVRLLAPISNYKDDTWKDLLEFPELKELKLQVHFGPVASGNIVPTLKTIEALHQHRQDIVGVDMEGIGIVEVTQKIAEYKPGFLMIRSVADLADSPKAANWSAYACDIAASYAIGLIKSGLIPSSKEVESSTVAITIPGDVKEFSVAQQKQLLEILSNKLEIKSSDIRIINIVSGSLKIVVEFTENTAESAAWLLMSNFLRETSALKHIGIQKVELVLQNKMDVDVGFVIALTEEFREFFPQIEAKPSFDSDINQYYYLFEKRIDEQNKYNCVATFIGGMGPPKAAVVADRLIQRFNPATIVNIGIAGSMEDEVFVGDVIVAEQTDSYLESSKAVENSAQNGFDFKLSGDPYKSSPDYIAHVRNLEFAYQSHAQNWANTCGQSLDSLVNESVRSKLLSKGLAKQKPQIHIGNIASGPIVGGTSFFVNWLKNNRDRKYLALEMESGGVMTAAYARSTPTLIIRGISDYCDKRKKSLDQISNGGLRRYAMGSAIALFWVLMDLQLVRHR